MLIFSACMLEFRCFFQPSCVLTGPLIYASDVYDNMSIMEAAELALRLLFFATMTDKLCGGTLRGNISSLLFDNPRT